MSDDLVKMCKRLSKYAHAQLSSADLERIADRIEELEAKLSKYVKACSDLSQQHISEWGRAEELEAKLAEVEAQLKATLDREAAAYARHDARAERAEARVKAALERAAGIAAVCHRHVEYGPTFAPSQDIHHDTPAEIRDLDPAEIVKEWKESKNA